MKRRTTLWMRKCGDRIPDSAAEPCGGELRFTPPSYIEEESDPLEACLFTCSKAESSFMPLDMRYNA